MVRHHPSIRWWFYDAACLVVLFTCIRVWTGPAPMLQVAQAQIPDAGAQRKQLVDETRRTNQLLGEIKDLLENRTLNVRIQGADNQLPAVPADRKTPPTP